MAKVKLEEKTLTDIAKAIRTKTGSTSLFLPAEMPSAILGITSPGGTSDATLSSGWQMLSGVTAYAKGIKYTGTMRTYIGQVDGTQGHVGSYTTYSGFYNVTPSTTPQVLSTSNCILLSGIHIASYPSEPATPVLSSLVALSNGSYSPPSGVDGFDSVVVDVAAEVIEPTLSDIEFVSNGTYYASDNNCDGFSEVSVAVPQTSLISSVFTGNGHFTADEGYAFDDVTVSVPALSIGTLSVSSNGFYYGGQFDAYSEITVEVPEPSMSTLEVTSNGTYAAADLELDGFTDVTVSVPENSATFMHKIISEAGVYNAADDEVDGYSQVTVTASGREPVLSSATFSENGSYSIPVGYDGFGDVVVNVAPPAVSSKTITANGTYSASSDGVYGYGEVVVNVPQSASLGNVVFTSNGVYQASTSGFDGFGQVTVSVDTETQGEIRVFADGVYQATDYGIAGWSLITVSVSAGYNYSFIAENAFREASDIYVANFPMVSSVGASAFYNCENLRDVQLESCTTIGNSAFAYCYNLKTVSLPVLSSVSAGTFYKCSSLERVELPQAQIVWGAFYGCTNLSIISIPACSYIGGRFESCGLRTIFAPSLTSTAVVTLDSSVSPYGETVDTCEVFLYARQTLENATLGLSSALARTFSGCSKLTYLSMSRCASLSYDALYKCSNLTTVFMPELSGLSTWFSHASKIEDATFGLFTTSSDVFSPFASALKRLVLPSCRLIDTGTFSLCSQLSELYLMRSVGCSLSNAGEFQNTLFAGDSPTGRIYVPSSLYASYIVSNNWSIYSAAIASIGG